MNANDKNLRPSVSSHGEAEIKLGRLQIKYGYLCQGGTSNDGRSAQNKDWFCTVENFVNNPNEAFFAVCDGHGKDGHLCAAYASDRIPR
jgi:serine/threonine protein phosphatase PrpC